MILSPRESLYRLLPQTTPENMQKSIGLFTVDPVTRYMNISPLTVTPAQVNTQQTEMLFHVALFHVVVFKIKALKTFHVDILLVAR